MVGAQVAHLKIRTDRTIFASLRQVFPLEKLLEAPVATWRRVRPPKRFRLVNLTRIPYFGFRIPRAQRWSHASSASVSRCGCGVSFFHRFRQTVSRGTLGFVFALTLPFSVQAQLEESVAAQEQVGESPQNETPEISRQDLPDAPDRGLPLPSRHMTIGERFQLYRHSIMNPDSVLSPAFGAALGQASNEPPEWGQGASGFGTRLASGYGRLVINRTIRFGVAALDHEDPRFAPSHERGFWRRFRSASFYYVVPRTDDGKRIPAFSRFAGAYGTAFVANLWYPESRANTGHALMRGSTALAAGYAWHVFREFWPDIKRAIHHPRDKEEVQDLEPVGQPSGQEEIQGRHD
jgi:hypothetical protein